MTNETGKELTPQKDGLALVVGGLFILALVFAAYNYFSKGANTEDTSLTTGETSQGTVEPKQEGSINGDGATDNKIEENVAGTAITDTTTAVGTLGTGGQYTWIPNSYSKGEIVGTNYTVKSGDTLWEIANGLYGDGTQWTKILDANKSNVGFLPSGSQALIVPGQVLVLP